MKKAIVPICVIIFLMFISCYLIILEYAKQKAVDGKIDTEEKISESINDEDGISAILLKVNEEEKIIFFQDISNEKIYELPYNNGLNIKNKYGDSMTFDELKPGEVMDIGYSKTEKKLKSLIVSDKVWRYTDINRFSFDEKKKIMYIADDAFQFTKNLRIFSDSKEAEIMDVTRMDVLEVIGIDRRILSVIIDKGHGYLRVKNDTYFVGGYIEIGQDIIKPITEDMLIPVAEGTYKVRVTNRGYAGEETVLIKRDKETDLDLSKIDIEEVAIGHIQFDITPDFAQLYIDNEITDFDDRIPLEFGVHNIRVECAGYDTVSTRIKVSNDYADIKITLDESSFSSSSSSSSEVTYSTSSSSASSSSTTADTSSSSTANNSSQSSSSSSSSSSSNTQTSSSNSSSSNTQTSSSSSSSSSAQTSSSRRRISTSKKIYVEQPEGVEVYLDGDYIGIAPVNTNKVTGSHVITLSKEGYQTKSYTVNIENDDNDVTFSFSALIAN